MRSKSHRFLIIVLLVLIVASGYFIFSDSKRAPQFAGYLTARKPSDPRKDTVILIQGKPEASMHIRGYTARFVFDPNQIQVTRIRYSLGVVSEGLGSDDRTLNTVNKTGIVKIMGETHEQDGASLKGNKITTIAEISVKKKISAESTLTLSSQDGAFYMITNDGKLVKVPMQNSAKIQVK